MISENKPIKIPMFIRIPPVKNNRRRLPDLLLGFVPDRRTTATAMVIPAGYPADQVYKKYP